jgi:hypothetical protein
MTEIRKVHDSAGELRFAYPHARGWYVVALGAGGLYLAWTRIDPGAVGARWAALIFAGLLLLLGVTSVLQRIELTVDLVRRRVRWRRGFIPNLGSGEGTLEELVEAVRLVHEIERNEPDEWEVELILPGWPTPVEVFESKDEAEATAEAEKLAERPGVPLKRHQKGGARAAGK